MPAALGLLIFEISYSSKQNLFKKLRVAFFPDMQPLDEKESLEE